MKELNKFKEENTGLVFPIGDKYKLILEKGEEEFIICTADDKEDLVPVYRKAAEFWWSEVLNGKLDLKVKRL